MFRFGLVKLPKDNVLWTIGLIIMFFADFVYWSLEASYKSLNGPEWMDIVWINAA